MFKILSLIIKQIEILLLVKTILEMRARLSARKVNDFKRSCVFGHSIGGCIIACVFVSIAGAGSEGVQGFCQIPFDSKFHIYGKCLINLEYRIYPKYPHPLLFTFYFSSARKHLFVCDEVYGPVNPMGSCRARSVYLTTRLLGRLSPLSGSPVLCTFFRQKLTTALLESAEGRE